MIELVVAPEPAGGVYDFSCTLAAAMGDGKASVVPLQRERLGQWQPPPEGCVVLQMSAYGFQRRGVPLWLLRFFMERRRSIRRFGVFFHELFAFGPPWSSSFWLSPVQRYICSQLAQISDFWWSNREGSAEWLSRFAPGKSHAVLPVFSSVGESPALETPRMPRLVVFGTAELRRGTYNSAGSGLFEWARDFGVEIHDIGSPIADSRLAAALHANRAVQHGRLQSEQVGALMRGASLGLLSYPSEYVAKSSVFAAYCAHGLCPILISGRYPTADGLTAGIHYLPGLPMHLSSHAARAVQQAAWDWYQPHNLRRHAESLARLCLRS